MGGEVVHDKVDFLAGGLCGDDFLEKADELLAGVAPGSASDELAASGLQGGIKGEGAVTENSNPCGMTYGPRSHGSSSYLPHRRQRPHARLLWDRLIGCEPTGKERLLPQIAAGHLTSRSKTLLIY